MDVEKGAATGPNAEAIEKDGDCLQSDVGYEGRKDAEGHVERLRETRGEARGDTADVFSVYLNDSTLHRAPREEQMLIRE